MLSGYYIAYIVFYIICYETNLSLRLLNMISPYPILIDACIYALFDHILILIRLGL